MGYKFSFASVLVALAAIACVGGETEAASVKGTVRDVGKTPPANGLSGAKVWLRFPGGNLSNPVISDTEGQYEIRNVANGVYRLVVTKIGYIPNPHETTSITVEGDTTASDILLLRAYGNSAYYSNFANVIVEKVGSKERVFTHEWNNLRTINLPPSSKAILARQLNEQDARAKEVVPDLKSYLAANPEAIMKAEDLFGQALAGKVSVPGKESLDHLKLGDEIVADLVLFQIKGSTAPEEKRRAFVNEFLLKWDNTPAASRFLAIK